MIGLHFENILLKYACLKFLSSFKMCTLNPLKNFTAKPNTAI